MAQNPIISRCLSLLRSAASELVTARQKSRKACHTLGSVDALEDRLLLAADFGDAPAPYPVSIADDGAQHEIDGPTLGLTVDSEADGVNSSLATGDGADEDGVVFSGVNVGRTDASVVVKVRNAPLGGRVDAWVDFNGNGSWSDPGEQILSSAAVTNNTNKRFSFAVPADAALGTSYARVRISTAGGLSPTGAAPDGEVEDHKVTIGLASPALTSPAAAAMVNVTGTYRVTFQWSEIPQADSYEIWVRSHDFEAQDEFHRTIVTGTSYTPDVDFGIGRYSVWMRSLGNNNVMSAWSALRQFSTVAKPAINPMTKMQPTARPTITWNPVLGAESYKVWVSNLSTRQSPVILQDVTTTSFTPNSSLPLGVYRIWVAAWSGGKSGGWSSPIDLQIAPAPIQNDLNPTMLGEKFSWSSVLGATSYEFQLKNLKTNELTLNISVQGTSLNQIPVLFSGTRYRWWVRAKSAQGVYSLWTGPRDFIAGGQTTVLTPTGSTGDRTPLFTWLAVEGAVKYELLLRREDVNSVILNKKDILTNSYTPTGDLAAGNYRVWIRAINSYGMMTTWSAVQTFTITSATSNDEPTTEAALVASLLSDDTDIVSQVPVLMATTASEEQPLSDDGPEDTPAKTEEAFGLEPEPIPVPATAASPMMELIDFAISAWTHRDVNQA